MIIVKSLFSFAIFLKPMSSLIEAYGHNRARQREKLAALLEDLGELQIEV